MSLAPTSPRLPSPPPPAEIQISPKSPGLGATATRQAQEMEQTIADANAKRRIHPGTKAEDMAAGPPLMPLNELDSAFQLQEHLAALHYHHTKENTQPITRPTAVQLATPPNGIDRTLWLYELCRFLVAQCNSLVIGFLFDTPPCSQATCPEMRASEWQFLCAVHDQPKSCCAIDYCCHTLDWAANVVTNPKIFPSRFVVLTDGHEKNAVLKNLINVFRRLHRIFAHAWFQHRGVFWAVEGQTGLYVFFKTVCDLYDLLPAENYKLPPEAEGLEPTPTEKEESQPKITAIAKPPARESDGSGHDESERAPTRSNTTRHIQRPSVGSAVATVIEEKEDESADVTSQMKSLHISKPEAAQAEEESEVEVPVIVEGEVPSSNTQSKGPPPVDRADNAPPQGVTVDVQDVSAEVTPAEGEDDGVNTGAGPQEVTTESSEEVKPEASVKLPDDPTATSTADFATDSTDEKSSQNGLASSPEISVTAQEGES